MVEYRDIIATDEVFEALTNEQMQVLNERDILQYIIENKRKSFVSNGQICCCWLHFLLGKVQFKFEFFWQSSEKIQIVGWFVCFGKI